MALPTAENSFGQVVLAGAVHIDRTGWLADRSSLGCSNPIHFDERPGGTSLNVASILGLLGHQPVLLTRLGNDANANWLRQIALDRRLVLESRSGRPGNTGTYTSVIEPDGSLLIGLADMTVYDSFLALDFSTIVSNMKTDGWLCVDANLPTKEIEKLIDMAGCRKIGLTVSKAKAPKLRFLLGNLDILFTNVREATALLETKDHIDTPILAAMLRETGVRSAVISDGENSVIVMDGQNVTPLPVQHVAKVVDVTGAGDALTGGTLDGLIRGMSLVDAAQIGIRAAHATIQAQGACRADLARLLKQPQVL